VYTAKDANTLKLTAAQTTTLTAAARLGPAALAAAFAGVAVAYQHGQLGPFVASVNEGIAAASDELTTMARVCTGARFVLAGFSQGAMVMHQLVLKLSDAAAKPAGSAQRALLARIFATVLIADGDKKKESAAIRFGTADLETQGIRSALTTGERDVPKPSSTYNICNAGDLVCDFKLPSLLNFSAAVKIHEKSYQVGPLVANIGHRVGDDLAIAVGRPTRISSGTYHSCAVTAAGAARCWGQNTYGQLGNGTTTSSSRPVAVAGLSSGVASVSVGGLHSCAVTTAGAALCWGLNGSGQLGNGTTTSSSRPVAVAGLSSGVASLASGDFHSCALTTAGAVRCWGWNLSGQLGRGNIADSATPVNVIGLGSGVRAVSAGADTSCVVTTGGAARCWGDNYWGELGTGTTARALVPTNVLGLSSGVASVSGDGGHTCAVTTAGAAKCWGYNAYGQVGNGLTSDVKSPVGVVGLGSGVGASSSGFYFTCATTTAGAVKCWGYNSDGELGNGTTTNSPIPVGVLGLP
jgi:hypothetical protein